MITLFCLTSFAPGQYIFLVPLGTVGITQIYQNIRKYCLKEAGEDIEQCKNRR